MVQDSITTSGDWVFCTFTLGASCGDVSTNEQVISVALCPPDHPPLHLQAQPLCHLPDLVDGGQHLILADEVPGDDHDGGWR